MKPRSNNRLPRTRSSGFSLIELIGVLAIMAILATAITPPAVRQLVRAKGAREDAALQTLGDGLKTYVRTRQQIPGANSWASSLATVLDQPAVAVERVDPARDTNKRVYLIHPSFAPSSGADPLYQQGAFGSATSPVEARILIVSTTQPALALPVKSGHAASTVAFDAIWNWHHDPSSDAPPAGWPKAWEGNGNFLHVARVNLAGLFHPTTFNNLQHPGATPFVKLSDGATVALAFTNAVERHLLEGTVIRLFKHDTPYNGAPLNPDDLDLHLVVLGAGNLLYDNDRWSAPAPAR